MGLLTAGLLYYDFRGDKEAAEGTLIDALRSLQKDENIKILSQEDDIARQRKIFERDFRGRVYQKEGDWPVQYGFEAFDNIWVDWSHYYWAETCTRRDGTLMSSQELNRKKFGDVQFIADRTFVGTMYWDDPDYWSTKSGENSFWKYFIRLSEDLSRVESGKLMYVDKNNDVIDYKFYGKRTFYYDDVDARGTATSGEMSYILHEILGSPESEKDEVEDVEKEREEEKEAFKHSKEDEKSMSGPVKMATKSSGCMKPSTTQVEENSTDQVLISRKEYEELKAYKQKFLDVKSVLRVASSYCNES